MQYTICISPLDYALACLGSRIKGIQQPFPESLYSRIPGAGASPASTPAPATPAPAPAAEAVVEDMPDLSC